VRRILVIAAVLCAQSATAQTIFVAGGSGRTGIEIVRALQSAGYDVLSSTRSAARASERFPDVDNWVEVDAHDTVALTLAVAGSDIVVSALGHGDFVGSGAPQFVGYLAVRNLVDAAVATGAKHVILVTASRAGHSRGVDHREEPRFGYVLFWKTKAEDYLLTTGLSYTIIGPGGLADEFLVQLRNLEAPPPRGWGVKIRPRSEYVRAFVDRKGVADIVLRAIRNPSSRNRAFAVVWDKSINAGEMSGNFESMPSERTGNTYIGGP